MKKTLLLALILFVSLLSGFAVDNPIYKEGIAYNTFSPSSVMSSEDLNYEFFVNPAKLSNDKTIIDALSVTAEVNHVAWLLSEHSDAFFNTSGLIDLAYDALISCPLGDTSLASVNLNAGYKKDHKALGVQIQANLATHRENPTNPPVNASLIPQIHIAVSAGYGKTFYESDFFNVEGGAVLHGIQKIVFDNIGVATVADLADGKTDMNTIFGKLKDIDAGFAFSSDFGLDINFMDGLFGFEFTFNNQATPFYMFGYSNLIDLLNYEKNDSIYNFYTPCTSGAYLSTNLQPSWKYGKLISGRIKIGVCSENLKLSTAVFDARFDLRLFNMFNATIQRKAGYNLYGLSFDLYENRIELLYGWHEEGKTFGEKPVDALTLKVSLGYGK